MEFMPRVSQRIDLKVLHGLYAGLYTTFVDEVEPSGGEIVLAHPMKDNTLVPLGPGTPVRLEYTQTGARIGFNTRITAVESKVTHAIRVAIPDRSEVERQQLRDFVRQEASLSLTYRVVSVPKGEEKPRSLGPTRSRTRDISGSGAQILCPESYPSKSMLEINLEVAGKLLLLQAEVIRDIQKVKENEWWMAVRFIGVNERDRDVIIRYIFDLQRDLRRRGLLGH